VAVKAILAKANLRCAAALYGWSRRHEEHIQ
jgi:hypothetical protein